MSVSMCVWRRKQGLDSCCYFISKSLLSSVKALCFSSIFPLLYRICKHYLFLYSLLNIIMWLLKIFYLLLRVQKGVEFKEYLYMCVHIYIYIHIYIWS